MLLLVPLLRQPTAALAVVAMVPAVALAARSVAYPLALGLAFSPAIALIGRDPLPGGAVVDIVFAWTLLSIVLWFFQRASNRREELFGLSRSTGPIVLSLLLVGLMVARLGASPAVGYGGQKLQLFIVGAIVSLIGGVIVGRSRKDFDLFIGITFIVSAFAAFILFIQLAGGSAQAAYVGRFTIAGSDPITLGRQAGTGFLIGMYLVTSTRKLWVRTAALAALPVLGVGLVASGGRGPVVGVVLGLVALFAFIGGDPVSRRRIPLTIIGGLLAAVLIAQFVPGEAVKRALSVLTGTGAGVSSDGRSTLWSAALQAFSAHPFFGLGTGGFATVSPQYLYPHNLVLEIASELGIIGLALILGILVSGGAIVVRNARGAFEQDRARAALVISLFVAGLTNAMFSGDLTTNGSVWLAIGLGIGISQTQGRVRLRKLAPTPRARPTVRGMVLP